MEVNSSTESRPEPRFVLRSDGNRARTKNPLQSARKKDGSKSIRNPSSRSRESGLDASKESSCSSDSSSTRSLVKKEVGIQRRRKHNGVRSVKIVPEVIEGSLLFSLPLSAPFLGKRRCSWITPNSEQVYVTFHDEEWGVPVLDDQKLFELLILSEALAELTWPAILKRRERFRKLFDNFDPSTVAKFTEKKITSLISSGSSALSEQKLRAVVENARQMLKVTEEFGSFSSYCWSFVNHKPIDNGFRYARQVPAKTPKAEAISKDLMQRGFRCVGPTVIYSFMQAAGFVNDHLSSCFRYEECIHSNTKEPEVTNAICRVLDKSCSLQT